MKVHGPSPGSLHAYCLALNTRLKSGGTCVKMGVEEGGKCPKEAFHFIYKMKMLPTVWQSGRKCLGRGAQIFCKVQTFSAWLYTCFQSQTIFACVLCHSMTEMVPDKQRSGMFCWGEVRKPWIKLQDLHPVKSLFIEPSKAEGTCLSVLLGL